MYTWGWRLIDIYTSPGYASSSMVLYVAINKRPPLIFTRLHNGVFLTLTSANNERHVLNMSSWKRDKERPLMAILFPPENPYFRLINSNQDCRQGKKWFGNVMSGAMWTITAMEETSESLFGKRSFIKLNHSEFYFCHGKFLLHLPEITVIIIVFFLY